MSAKDTIAMHRCSLSGKELNEFLSSYPIPSEYDVILPTSTQTIFDAPPGYVGLYTHSFSLANLRLPLTDFFSYGYEPSVDLFQGFLNLCRAGSWLTFQKRSEKHIPNHLPKYLQLLLDENKLNLKSFKDKHPPNIDENPYFQRLGRYPTSVRVFNDPILFLAGLKPSWEFGQQRPVIIVGGKEMDFRNFIYTEDDDDLAFLPKEPSLGFGTGSPSASVNTELPKDVEEPKVQPAEITTVLGESPKAGVFIVHPESVAARIKERKCKTRGGSSRPHVKRKLAFESSSSRVVRAKTFASKDDAHILSISDDDEDKFPVHLVLSEGIDLLIHSLSSIYIVVDNVVNRRARKFLQVVEKMSGEADVIKASVGLHYAAMELVYSDELGRLVGTLVSSTITYGRCRAYEQVAAMKDPFDLSKAKGYRSSYKKEHTHVSNDFAPMLCSFGLGRRSEPTQMHVPSSQKATPSSASSSNPMSPPADLVKPSPSPFE
ncbi:hypothetical protein Tco_0218662 [Tanacetum coccineum]